jgi:hypothetical protein
VNFGTLVGPAQPVQLTALGYIVEKIGTTERVLLHAVAQRLPPTGSGGQFEIDLASWSESLGRLGWSVILLNLARVYSVAGQSVNIGGADRFNGLTTVHGHLGLNQLSRFGPIQFVDVKQAFQARGRFHPHQPATSLVDVFRFGFAHPANMPRRLSIFQPGTLPQSN